MKQSNLDLAFEPGDASLRRESLQQQIYDRRRQRLIAGAYQSGEAVWSRGLAIKRGVSAMPVREALTRLTVRCALEAIAARDEAALRAAIIEDIQIAATDIRAVLAAGADNPASGAKPHDHT